MENNYFSQRRTVRSYSDKPISEETLKSIIEQAMRAPTTGNMQLYSVVVTRDEEMKKRLAPTHFNQPTVMGCQVMLTICADFNRFVRWCEVSNATPGYDNFQSFISATLDATMFAQQIVTIAEMQGIGTCYLGTVTYNAPQIAEILNLPKRVIPIACITMGYPNNDTPKCERLPLEAIFNSETYHECSDEEIKELYRAKDDFEPNQKFIKENNKQTLAQVFTDVRYTKQANETFSKIFLDFIIQQGFTMPD
jgi:nitroreductase